MSKLTVIGDVHGQYREYIKIANQYDYTLQLGDMGFHYNRLKPLSYKKHKFFGGNHDNYDTYDQTPYSIGNFGSYTHGGVKFFFIRGAFSIDKPGRLKAERRGKGKSWWVQENLNEEQRFNAYHAYVEAKPDIVITHTCPTFMAKKIGNPGVLRAFGYIPETFSTVTQELLETCWEAHKPKTWLYGHFHKSLTHNVGQTTFRCVNILETVTINQKGLVSKIS